MPISRLDKSSHVPLYRQLYDRLVGQIALGDLQAGDRIPSERELAEQLSVSRVTARHALEALVESGFAYREQGRGTFVAEPRMQAVEGFASFTEDMLSRGRRPSSRVIAQDLVVPDEKVRQVLKLEAEEMAIHLVRVRLADGEPVALQSAHIPHWLCPGLETEDFSERSLYDVLRQNYYVHPAWTEAEMEALPANVEEARLLEINQGDPVLVVRGITYTESFDVVESVRTAYRGKGLALYIGRQRIRTDHRSDLARQ